MIFCLYVYNAGLEFHQDLLVMRRFVGAARACRTVRKAMELWLWGCA